MEVFLPQLGFSMEEGKLVEWLVPDGAAVSEGEPIYSIEGDKAVQEIEAPATGVIKLIASADEIYPVGTLLCEIY
jgi:pyruvate/2-oxoglutarate dehydrogenase complex dihydrolipoamide acyltransferase (E2) component